MSEHVNAPTYPKHAMTCPFPLRPCECRPLTTKALHPPRLRWDEGPMSPWSVKRCAYCNGTKRLDHGDGTWSCDNPRCAQYRAGERSGATNRRSAAMSEPASWSEDHTFDAWEVGVHPVPAKYPGTNISVGTVIIHDKQTDEWTMVPVEQFDRDFEWA